MCLFGCQISNNLSLVLTDHKLKKKNKTTRQKYSKIDNNKAYRFKNKVLRSAASDAAVQRADRKFRLIGFRLSSERPGAYPALIFIILFGEHQRT